MGYLQTFCKACRGSKRAGIGGRLVCRRCTGTGVERVAACLRGFWVDLATELPDGGCWRLRVVGRERVPFETVDLSWHAMGLDFWLGRSRETWPDLEHAMDVGRDVIQELRARRAVAR